MIQKPSDNNDSASIMSYSKTLNISEISCDRGINAIPMFPTLEKQSITNESITVIDDSSLEYSKPKELNNSLMNNEETFNTMLNALCESKVYKLKNNFTITSHPVISLSNEAEMKEKLDIQCKLIGGYQLEKELILKKLSDAQVFINKLRNENKNLKAENKQLKVELEKQNISYNSNICNENSFSSIINDDFRESFLSDTADNKLRAQLSKISKEFKKYKSETNKALIQINKCKDIAENELYNYKIAFIKLSKELNVCKALIQKQSEEILNADIMTKEKLESYKNITQIREQEFISEIRSKDILIKTLKEELNQGLKSPKINQRKVNEYDNSIDSIISPESTANSYLAQELKQQFNILEFQGGRDPKTLYSHQDVLFLI